MIKRELQTRPIKGGTEPVLVLSWRDTPIAIFREDPKSLMSLGDMCDEHIRIYGYMFEWRRQWNLGNQISWSEDIRVNLPVS